VKASTARLVLGSSAVALVMVQQTVRLTSASVEVAAIWLSRRMTRTYSCCRCFASSAIVAGTIRANVGVCTSLTTSRRTPPRTVQNALVASSGTNRPVRRLRPTLAQVVEVNDHGRLFYGVDCPRCGLYIPHAPATTPADGRRPIPSRRAHGVSSGD
jgi:hypothetical protein